jgi:hypothetical protein
MRCAASFYKERDWFRFYNKPSLSSIIIQKKAKTAHRCRLSTRWPFDPTGYARKNLDRDVLLIFRLRGLSTSFLSMPERWVSPQGLKKV